MGILEDILSALERIPIWKRLQGIPHEVDDLKRRLVELEGLINGKVAGAVCPYCGSRKFHLDHADMHGQREVWKCDECGKDRQYRLDLKQKPPTRG
jgi:transposase-like protein